MTCIVGIVDNDKVWMGADSCGCDNYNKFIRKDTKLFKNGEFLIGYTSSFRMGQLLRFQCSFPKYTKDLYEDEYQYMCTDFIEEIRAVFRDYGYSRIDSNENSGGTFLVGFNGRLFEVADDFQVGELIIPYNSVGSGKLYAIGSMHTQYNYGNVNNPKAFLEAALEAATEFSIGVEGPYTIMSI